MLELFLVELVDHFGGDGKLARILGLPLLNGQVKIVSQRSPNLTVYLDVSLLRDVFGEEVSGESERLHLHVREDLFVGFLKLLANGLNLGVGCVVGEPVPVKFGGEGLRLPFLVALFRIFFVKLAKNGDQRGLLPSGLLELLDDVLLLVAGERRSTHLSNEQLGVVRLDDLHGFVIDFRVDLVREIAEHL